MRVPSTAGSEDDDIRGGISKRQVETFRDDSELGVRGGYDTLSGTGLRKLNPGQRLPDLSGARRVIRGVQAKPSETDLLLALAEMHRQGAFKTAQTDEPKGASAFEGTK